MPHMISRIRFAVKKIAKKVRWTRKTLSFSRNKAPRGVGASSDGLFQNPGLSVLPTEPLFIHCYPNVFPDLCYCRECVHYCRAAPQLLPDERRVDYDLAQVSVGLPPQTPPSAFIDVSLPTSPSVMSLPNPRAARTDEELFADIDQWCSKWSFLPGSDPVPNGERQVEVLSTALESSEPVIATFAESPPTLSVPIMTPPNLYARTDEQLFADIDNLFCDIEQWYTKHGFLPEDPVPNAGQRPEALVSTVSERPIIITFAEPQPTLSAIMYQDFYGLLPPYSYTVRKLPWEEEEPYATGMGRVLEAPAAFGCSDEDEDEDEDEDDEDDSSLETVTPHRLSLIKGAGR